ncbi:Arginase/deacetylase [Anaeromyces robustus]|uniref:histone deacetylase n=1 Tax=Anaeromyces robustus TaxID=1754192 RepID=A0A1Y1XMK8_9FUNG|nr:Arginase/deacetylase [Anaeromyces robustus]|eukprot:ORX86967.1 Arginase/deacetylase [Anaeromyces robustus]
MEKKKLDELVETLDSLYLNNKSEQVARLSCGGAIELCKAVWRGDIQNGMAIIRPPGHHAEADRARGFCLYNNVAVAARCLQRDENVKKIMVLDWDIHHGNGIQDIFFDDPDILYISIHRYDGGNFYPYSSDADMDVVGGEHAKGRNINIPWPCGGMGDAEYIYTFNRIILPIAYEFAPDIVIVAAGFDASKDDLLGGCKVSPACFGHMTHMLKSLSGGKLALILEGGYNVEATANAMTACVSVLLNESPPKLKSLSPMDSAYETIQEVTRIQSHYWDSLAPVYMKPCNGI